MTIDGRTARVAFEWDCAGSRDFDYDELFFPDIPSSSYFYPTLDEIAIEDEDNDGVAGEGAIDGHYMEFYVTSIIIAYLKYNFETGEYLEYSDSFPVDVLPGTNPEIKYGVALNNLVVMEQVTEESPGVYRNIQTVHDYCNISGAILTYIMVLEYNADIYDMEVYECE